MYEIVFTVEQQKKTRKLGVMSIYIFGSRAEGLANELSDYDFGVLLFNPALVKPGMDVLPLYHELYDFFDPLCPRTEKNDIIDIVFLQGGVSLELQANVVKNGKVIFDECPEKRAEYEAQVMLRMADMQPVLKSMDRDIINRI